VGYRFIAPVQEDTGNAQSVPQSQLVAVGSGSTAEAKETRQHLWPALLGISAVLIAVTAGYFVLSGAHDRPKVPGGRLTVAVLPFENLTGDAAQEYLSDGLTEEMIGQIGRLDPEHLGVIARTSVMHYKRGQVQLDQIGRELGVQYVLEGSLRRDAGKVRITAQLVQMKDQTPVWSREYDREPSSLLALQGEIAQEIADEIQLTLGRGHKFPASDRKLAAAPSSYEAYDLYLKGRYFWNKRTKEGFQQAAEYFQKSIDKDLNYARAYAGLADTFALMSSWSYAPQIEFMPKARAAALRALQLDDGLAEAHTSLALIAENYDYDWRTAEREFRRAIELDPQYATAHQWYAECLSFQGRYADALAESERARQLDPLSLIIATDHGAILYFARQYDRAIDQFNAVLAMEPSFSRAQFLLRWAYVANGMFAEALAPAEAGIWHHSDGTPLWEVLAYIHARSGRQAQARSEMAKWEQLSRKHPRPLTDVVLMAYVAMDEKDKALALLAEAYQNHSISLTTLKVEPAFDPLRGEPRFQDLLRRIGLAK
jgi:TolB-like protein/Flp pilus assembly protein TadD